MCIKEIWIARSWHFFIACMGPVSQLTAFYPRFSPVTCL